MVNNDIKKSIAMELLISLSQQKPDYLLQTDALVYVCSKHINHREYSPILDIYDKLDKNQALNENYKWLFYIAKLHTRVSLDDRFNDIIPDDIFIDNSVIHYKHGDSKCLIFFTSHDVQNAGSVVSSLRQVLKPFGISLMFILDSSAKAGLQGLGGLTINKTMDELNNIFSALQYTNLITIGSSLPGLTSLVYGLKMNMDAIWVFNPLTSLSSGIQDNQNLGSYSTNLKLKDIHTEFGQESMDRFCVITFGRESFPNIDVPQYLLDNKKTKVFLHYSKNFKPDQEAAQRLSGFANVELIPHEHDNHFLLGYLYQNNLFQGLFRDFLQKINWL